MGSEEDFRSNLYLVDNLFCAVVENGKRYACRSKKTALDTWKISCTNTVNMFWELELEFDDVMKHKKSLGIENENFENYFARFKDAFENDKISITLQNGQLLFTAWCTFDDKQVSHTFKLNAYHEEECADRISRMLFDLVALVNKSNMARSTQKDKEFELQLNLGDNKAFGKNVHSQIDLNDFYHPSQQSNLVKHSRTLPTNKKGVQKRKTGYSIINPTVKRIAAKGARIGEDCTPPKPLKREVQV